MAVVSLELKQFQTNAVEELYGNAQWASQLAQAGKTVAVVLTAPTGSGKTVMAAALLDTLVLGSSTASAGVGSGAADPDATFLWLTDQPELNEQTRRKFLAASRVFDEQNLITIEGASFDQEALDPGCLYFLNTQKLSVTSRLVQKGDHRQFTLWETIANTAARRRGSFWLILDEAHRGMHANGGNSVKEAQSIVQKFIKGDPDVGLEPVPLILGISATPDRFTTLLDTQTDRTRMGVSVSPEDVRSSGLLKEVISLFHTDEQQPSDESLLAAAAVKLQEFEEGWQAYADIHSADVIRPVLVVQVEDKLKTSKSPTKTNLASAIKVLEDTLGPIDPKQLAHAFQEGDTVMVDGTVPIRYLAPADIQDDPDVRVIFFKRSLTTGWDCPRAEVMMSFRTAKDETLIAQLVGRMVRTPLARAATGSALLNSVALFLPQYDRDAVTSVIKRLSEPHPEDGLPGIDTQDGNETVTLKPDPAMAAVFAAAADLPSYRVERVAKLSPIRRLMRLGDRLVMDNLDTGAKRKFERALLEELDAQRQRLSTTDATYASRLDEAALIDVRRQDVDVTTLTAATAETDDVQKIRAHALNIEHAFADAGRRLGEGLHRAYLKARAEALLADGDTLDVGALKREAWVLSADTDVVKAVEDKANALCDAELSTHETNIKHLSDETRAQYRAILREGAKPKAEPWNPPDSIDGDIDGTPYAKHIYVKPAGGFTKRSFTGLEGKTLAEELAREDVLGWLRNVERKSWAFSTYYSLPGGPKAMYPDFLVFRQDGKHIVCDILEPHTLSQSDSVAKAKGLAAFAEAHGHRFGRIQMLDEVDGELKRLDFTKPDTRKRVNALDSSDALRQLLADQP